MRILQKIFACLLSAMLCAFYPFLTWADMLAPTSQTKRVKGALERTSYVGLKVEGVRSLINPPRTAASFELENGSPMGARVMPDTEVQHALAQFLGIPVDQLYTWCQQSVGKIQTTMKALRKDYPWLALFEDKLKVKIVYGRSSKVGHWDRDGNLVLAVDAFANIPPDALTGDLKAAYTEALTVLQKATLLHEGLHESEPFHAWVEESFPGQSSQAVQALVELFASYAEIQLLVSEIRKNPVILEVYRHSSNTIMSESLEPLLKISNESEMLQEIAGQIGKNLDKYPDSTRQAWKALTSIQDWRQKCQDAWRYVHGRIEFLALSKIMFREVETSMVSFTHYLNNSNAVALGNLELYHEAKGIDAKRKIMSSVFKGTDALLQRYRNLQQVQNPDVVVTQGLTKGQVAPYDIASEASRISPEDRQHGSVDLRLHVHGQLAEILKDDVDTVEETTVLLQDQTLTEAEMDIIVKQLNQHLFDLNSKLKFITGFCNALHRNPSVDFQKNSYDQEVVRVRGDWKVDRVDGEGKSLPPIGYSFTLLGLSRQAMEVGKIDLGDIFKFWVPSPGAPETVVPIGLPHPGQIRSGGANMLFIAFDLANGRMSPALPSKEPVIAEADSTARARVGVAVEESIPYKAYQGEGPLGNFAIAPDQDVSHIEFAVEAKDYPNLLSWVLAHEHRHRVLAKEKLLEMLGTPPKLVEPASEIFALLGEILDAKSGGYVDDAIRQYEELEQREGPQPMLELLRAARDRERIGREFVEYLVQFLLKHRLDIYARIDTAGMDLLQRQGTEIISNPKVFAPVMARLNGVQRQRWGDRAIGIFSKYVHSSLWDGNVHQAVRVRDAVDTTARSMEHWFNNNLMSMSMYARLLAGKSSSPDRARYLFGPGMAESGQQQKPGNSILSGLSDLERGFLRLEQVSDPSARLPYDTGAGTFTFDSDAILKKPADAGDPILALERDAVVRTATQVKSFLQDLLHAKDRLLTIHRSPEMDPQGELWAAALGDFRYAINRFHMRLRDMGLGRETSGIHKTFHVRNSRVEFDTLLPYPAPGAEPSLDYKQIADLYRFWVGDKDRFNELAYYHAAYGKIGERLAAVILQTWDRKAKESWLRAILGMRIHDAAWGSKWAAWLRNESNPSQRLAGVAALLGEYYRSNPQEATALLTDILGSLALPVGQQETFLGREEAVDGTGERLDHLMRFLPLLPREMLLQALDTLDVEKMQTGLEIIALTIPKMHLNAVDIARTLIEFEKLLSSLALIKTRRADAAIAKGFNLDEDQLQQIRNNKVMEIASIAWAKSRLVPLLVPLAKLDSGLATNVLKSWIGREDIMSEEALLNTVLREPELRLLLEAAFPLREFPSDDELDRPVWQEDTVDAAL